MNYNLDGERIFSLVKTGEDQIAKGDYDKAIKYLSEAYEIAKRGASGYDFYVSEDLFKAYRDGACDHILRGDKFFVAEKTNDAIDEYLIAKSYNGYAERYETNIYGNCENSRKLNDDINAKLQKVKTEERKK